MSHDDQITAALGTALRAELADVHAAPGLAGTIRRRHTRQTRLLQAAAATPVIAAVTAFTIASTGSTGPAGRSGDHVIASTAGVRNVAYVTEHADTALTSLSHYVMMTTSFQAGRTTWTDPVTGRSRSDTDAADGTTLTTSVRSGPVSQGPSVLTVDNTARTWWTTQLPPVSNGAAGMDAFTDPQQIRAALRSGVLQLIGDERIGGRDTIHLRLTGRAQGGLPQIDLWVDASTFLPVRLVGTKGTVTSAIDYTWLTRTAANLAKTELTVPTGYTHRDTPPAQPARVRPAN